MICEGKYIQISCLCKILGYLSMYMISPRNFTNRRQSLLQNSNFILIHRDYLPILPFQRSDEALLLSAHESGSVFVTIKQHLAVKSSSSLAVVTYDAKRFTKANRYSHEINYTVRSDLYFSLVISKEVENYSHGAGYLGKYS